MTTLFKMKFFVVLLCVIAVQLVAAEKDDPCSVDAAVTYTNDKIYFFKGDRYGRYDDDDDDDRKIASSSRKLYTCRITLYFYLICIISKLFIFDNPFA